MRIRNSPTLPDAAPTHFVRPGSQLAYARDEGSGAAPRPAGETRILVIEDDFLVASEAEAALSDAGFEIAAVVASAEEAIGVVSRERPDLAIVDIRLAGKRDGIDAAIELFEQYGVPCVFATAHSDVHARTRAERAKPLGWLQKPYSMMSLVRLVHNALDQIGKGE